MRGTRRKDREEEVVNGRMRTLGRWVHMPFYKHEVRLKRTRDMTANRERKKTVGGRNKRNFRKPKWKKEGACVISREEMERERERV